MSSEQTILSPILVAQFPIINFAPLKTWISLSYLKKLLPFPKDKVAPFSTKSRNSPLLPFVRFMLKMTFPPISTFADLSMSMAQWDKTFRIRPSCKFE